MEQRASAPNPPRPKVAPKDNRRFRRIRCSEATHFITRKGLHEGVIKNFSPGGTYIEVEGFFFAGQEVTVAGPFATDWKESKQKGAIVRYDGKGIAVKFASPTA